MKTPIMAHMVAHYPDARRALEVGAALLDSGIAFLEVQFPFSDPTADGPAIQTACTQALEAGFRVSEGFSLVAALAEHRDAKKMNVPIMIMSYASLVCARGIAQFCRSAKEAGAAGLIIPDLPIDSDEGLYAEGASVGLDVVPVIVPSMSRKRVDLLFAARPHYVYAALRSGITGNYTTIGEENIRFLESLRPLNAKVFAGFGIRERTQITALAPHVHAVVVGSAIVRTIAAADDDNLRASVKSFMDSLTDE